MSELISGKEALQDIENSQISCNTGKWFPLINCEFKIHEILDGRSDTGNSLKFRLKPRTITINGVELNQCYSVAIDYTKNEVKVEFKNRNDAEALHDVISKLYGFK